MTELQAKLLDAARTEWVSGKHAALIQAVNEEKARIDERWIKTPSPPVDQFGFVQWDKLCCNCGKAYGRHGGITDRCPTPEVQYFKEKL